MMSAGRAAVSPGEEMLGSPFPAAVFTRDGRPALPEAEVRGRTRIRDALKPVGRGFCVRMAKTQDSREGKLTHYQLASQGSSPPHHSDNIQ